MKKRLLSLVSGIAAGVILLTAAGCGTGSDSSDTTKADVEPTITLGEYIGMDVEVEVIAVTDEEVDESIRKEVTVAVTDRAVADGDTVNIDYSGAIDGEVFDSNEGYDLVIGSGTFIEDFEDQLIGSNIEDTVTVNVTFPDDYQNTDVAGQAAEFSVVINSITASPDGDLTDDIINEFTDGEYTTLEDYRAYIRATLENDAETTNASARDEAIIEKLMSICSVDNPTASRVQKYVDNYYEMYESYASMYSMEFSEFVETYMGVDEDGFETQVRSSSEYYISYILVMEAIAEEQDISISDDEYLTMLESGAAANSADTSTYEKSYGAFMKDELIYTAVMEYLVSVSNITEVPTSSTSSS